MASTCPEIKAVSAGPVPLNGIDAGFTPRIELSSKQVVNDTDPTPACAMFSVATLAFT